MEGGECGWELRIVTGDPQWIALRTVQQDSGAPRHLLLSELDLPGEWAEAAYRDWQVTVAIGPRPRDDIAPALPADLAEEMEELRESSFLVTESASAAGCTCAALTAGHVAEVIGASVLVTTGVRVMTGAGLS